MNYTNAVDENGWHKYIVAAGDVRIFNSTMIILVE